MANAPATGYRIESLGQQHDRGSFSCSIETLDRYFREQAGQDSRKRVATCFVLISSDGSVAGYYTLSATGIALSDLPAALARKLPRYPAIPATLMGRLAVERSQQGRGLGELLLLDAFSRTLRSEIASYAFVVDAENAAAEAFYEHYGFLRLAIPGSRWFLPVAEIAAAFA